MARESQDQLVDGDTREEFRAGMREARAQARRQRTEERRAQRRQLTYFRVRDRPRVTVRQRDMVIHRAWEQATGDYRPFVDRRRRLEE
jgi:hypothetical protein